MTSDGTKCFEYNEANQMYRVKTCSNNQIIAEYIYDYSGKRLVKKEYENGVLKQTVYSPTDEYETKKIEGGATQNTIYYKANDELAAKKNPDGTINYYHNDHLGSATVLTDQSGAVVEKSSYEPYGEIKQGGTKSKFGYTGQEKDSETGLNYYDARYYDPHLQRFIQPDTLLPDIYDPQQLNRYSYARNNPLKYTDPTGHWAWLNNLVSNIQKSFNKIASNFISKPAPKPESVAKLPNNIPNTSVNLQNTNGNNNSAYGRDTTISSYIKDVQTRGHVDIGISGSITGLISVGGGAKINNSGSTQYVSGAIGREAITKVGLGGSVIFSTKPVKQQSIETNFTVNAIIAGQMSVNAHSPYDINKWDFEGIGIGCCGFDITAEYIGKTYPHFNSNNDINFTSKNYYEIYGK